MAISDALVSTYNNPDWQAIKENFELSLSIDELVSHEYQYYCKRYIDSRNYCQYEISEGLSMGYQQNFKDSQYFCSDIENLL